MSDESYEIVLVCTGNICRSPMAEALLRSRLASRQVPATVSSTGLVLAGRRATADAVAAVGRLGATIDGHLSRVLVRDQVAGADLILGMERSHVREVAVLAPDLFPRTFTLRELVRRGEASGPRSQGESLDEWLRRVGSGRRPVDLLGVSSDDDDVADPYQLPAYVYERTASDIDDLLSRLVDLAWPAALTRSGPAGSTAAGQRSTGGSP